MIKIENVVLPSAEQMEAVVRGMRNPMNSWGKSDSYMTYVCDESVNAEVPHRYVVGEADLGLMESLAEAGSDHRKYLRMMQVFVDITAPLYWWKEYDTYKVGTVANSCSTMHKIHEKPFSREDFSCERMTTAVLVCLDQVIAVLEERRQVFVETKDRAAWDDMIQLLPTSFNQMRTCTLNYEVLRNMYHARRAHKLNEWRGFCAWMETLPFCGLITGVWDEKD